LDKREEVAHKLARVRRWLSEQHQPALLVRQRSNFAWITAGGRSHVNSARDTGAAALLITANRFVLLASNIEAQRLVDEELVDVPVDVAPYPWHDDDGERRLIAGIVGSGAAPVVDSEPGVAAAVAGLRATLLGPEIRRLEQLGEITSGIVEAVCRRIEPGETEHEVAAQLHAAAVAHGARVPVCLIAADDRIALAGDVLQLGLVRIQLEAVVDERAGDREPDGRYP
jgi:antitoxin VapB